jgi:hypothetical protein
MLSVRHFSSFLAAILVAVLACREEPTAPTVPETPMLATTATAALAFFQVSGGGRHTCGETTGNRA